MCTVCYKNKETFPNQLKNPCASTLNSSIFVLATPGQVCLKDMRSLCLSLEIWDIRGEVQMFLSFQIVSVSMSYLDFFYSPVCILTELTT